MTEQLWINHAAYPANVLYAEGSPNDLNGAALASFERQLAWWKNDYFRESPRQPNGMLELLGSYVESGLNDEFMQISVVSEHLAHLTMASGGPTDLTMDLQRRVQEKIADMHFALHPQELQTKTKGPFSLPRGMSQQEVNAIKEISGIFYRARTLFDIRYQHDSSLQEALPANKMHIADQVIDRLILHTTELVKVMGPQDALHCQPMIQTVEWLIKDPVSYYNAIAN